MPAAVDRQRRMLAAMLRVAEREPALRWFELGCSLARNGGAAGDALSDVDCAVGVSDDDWEHALDFAGPLAAAAGGDISPMDEMRQLFPGRAGMTCWHVFTLYRDGSQLSLVLMPASWRAGLPLGSVALYDPDGRLAQIVRPPSADADAATLREWACLGWIALADLAKYLDRGSIWEAYQRLHDARQMLWKLWAAGSGVDFPEYGLTAILDEPPGAPSVALPPAVDETVATLDANSLRAAAVRLATLLDMAVDRVGATLRAAGLTAPDGLAAFAARRLTRSG